MSDLTAPLEATVFRLDVAVGDVVAAGDAVVTLEAMKMEIPVTAETAGTVAELRVAEGAAVGEGDVVAVLTDA